MKSDIGFSYEKLVHRVVIAEPFWLGKYEVTQAEWESVMRSNPSNFKGRDLPVEMVSWDDCQEFIRRLNAKDEGFTYRLPTEAEWEYSCRAWMTGDYAGNLDAMGWYGENSGGETHRVGQKQANAWRPYDMHGNVCEWCQDWYEELPSVPVTNPTGPRFGFRGVARGGGWDGTAVDCRSPYRNSLSPGSRSGDLGFRLVRMQK